MSHQLITELQQAAQHVKRGEHALPGPQLLNAAVQVGLQMDVGAGLQGTQQEGRPG